MEKKQWKDAVDCEVKRVLLLFFFACLTFLYVCMIMIHRSRYLTVWSITVRVFWGFDGKMVVIHFPR